MCTSRFITMEEFWMAVTLNCIITYIYGTAALSTSIACEGQYIPLECSAGLSIHILDANFGRTEVAPCDGNTSLVTCVTSGTLDIVKGICETSNTCSILSSTTVFNDPCPEVTKYLEVTFECLGGPTEETVRTTDSITTQDLLTTTALQETITASSQPFTTTQDTSLTQTTPACSCTQCRKSPVNQLTLVDLVANPEIVQELTKNITAELKIDKKTLSSAKRRITSAQDNRVSATFVGYLGIVVLTVVFGLIIITDVVNIVIPCVLGQRTILYDRPTS